MNGAPPRAIKSLISILLIAVIVFALILAMVSVGLGYVPSWALAILIGAFISLVIVRIVAMFRFGYPPYDFTRLYEKNTESKEKKK